MRKSASKLKRNNVYFFPKNNSLYKLQCKMETMLNVQIIMMTTKSNENAT